MIEVSNLSRRYGTVQALRGVSLQVEGNGITGILGQNGAGKTTLLNILTGYLAPTEGWVKIGGQDTLLSPMAARRNIGYLPENPPLYDDMTVKEYLFFASRLRGVAEKAVADHVEEVMALTGLTAMKKRLVGHLSKGYRQRAGLAQALCGDGEILVLDEPTVGLDPLQITEIRSLIRKLGREKTILFSSHILSEVEQLCDRILILDRGEVRLDTALVQQNRGILCKWRGSQKPLSLLKALPGLLQLETLPGEGELRCVRLFFEPGTEHPEERIFRCFSTSGVPLQCLCREQNSLEKIFLNVLEEQKEEQKEGEEK